MPPAETTGVAGERVARVVRGYELLSVIGRGGMATVYLARQGDLRRLVALKELGGLRAPEPSYAQRFVREARVAGALSHPSIVTVHDFFEQDATPYIAMEYVSGGTLRPHVGGVSLAQTAGMLESVLAGLAHAEEQEIVHRDLKPENLMVAADGRVKIADFGIAKATGALQTASFRTETGTTIGTPSYMAPEQAMGQEVGPWTDLYSLGVVTFEMLVGRTPFYDSDSPMSIVFRHINEPIPPVSELEPDVDPALSDWIDRLLEKDPALRTSSAAAAWDELEDVVIDALGPRWRDHSRFVPATPPALGTVPLERPVTTERTAATRVVREGAWPPPATPYEEGEPTVMPAAPTQPLPQRRRTPLLVLAVLTLLAIVAAAAAFAGGGRGGGSSTTPAAAPARDAAPAQAPAPSSSSSSSSSPPSGGPSSSSSPPSGGPSSSSSPPSGGPSSSSSPPSGGSSGGDSSAGGGSQCAGDSVSDDPSDDSCGGGP